MKSIKHSLLLIMVLAAAGMIQAQGIVFEHGTWAEVKAKAALLDKPIFVDCLTDWCGPCKWMSRTTFPDEEVGKFFNENFVCYKLDMEKGEGKDFAERHGVRVYPTLMFLNANEEVLYRKAGALDPEAFIALGKQSLNPELQLPALLDLYASGKRDSEFMQSYILTLDEAGMEVNEPLDEYRKAGHLEGEKLLEPGNFKIFQSLFRRIDTPEFLYFRDNHTSFVAAFGDEADYKLFYNYQMAVYQAIREEDDTQYQELLSSLEADGVPQATRLSSFCKMTYAQIKQDWEKYPESAAAYIEATEGPDWQVLNRIAWIFFENVDDKDYLKKACEWAALSVEKDKNSYNLDTQAMLLYKCGDYEAAIPVAEEAIALAEEEGTDLKETKEALAKMKGK